MADTAKHICRVGTARIDYQGRVGQRVLNTTVKSGTGLGVVFAPTWKIVMASKQNTISWQSYVEAYTALMRQRYQAHPSAFLEALSSNELIVCCYCKETPTRQRNTAIATFWSRYLKRSHSIMALVSRRLAKFTEAGDEPVPFLPYHITNLITRRLR